jgi:hypothetical protein
MVGQRVRWMTGQMLITQAMSAQQLAGSFFKRASEHPGTWRAFLSIVASSQLPCFVTSISHLLPFRTQLALALPTLACDLRAFHWRKLQIMQVGRPAGQVAGVGAGCSSPQLQWRHGSRAGCSAAACLPAAHTLLMMTERSWDE